MHPARAIPCLIGIALLGSLDLGAQAQPGNQQPGESPSTETPAPTPASPWAGTVELYGFAPIRTTGTTTINGFSTDTDLSLGDVLSKLKWATSIRGSLENERIGLLTDLSYVKLGQYNATQRRLLSGQAEVTGVQGIYDLALRYRFGNRETAVGQPGQFSVIPYAGIRIIDAQLDVSAQVDERKFISFQRQGSFGRTWVQPLIGTQATVFLSPRLRAFARADIGGFNLSGSDDLSGNAQLGLGYAIGNSTDLNISWRYLGLNYNNGETPDSGFSSYQNGVEIGLKFFF
ncbi:MAG: hypothetical protein RLZZ268_996 [Cyanobacteriota bacterium]|jgi:hypothetical protein